MRNIMKNVLILGAGGQIARHVINQLADKQTIKQTLFARQPAKIHKPYPTNSQIIMGDVLNHAALKQAMQGQDIVYANWICPYISRHLLSLNPLQARCRRYSRGER